MTRFFTAALLAITALPVAAGAQSYSLGGDFGSNVFQYGQGTAGVSFTGFGQAASCPSGQVCYAPSGGTFPYVRLNNSGDTIFANGTVIPTGGVFFHPSQGDASGNAAIIRFVAPVGGSYSLVGSFARLDTTSGGDGVVATVTRGLTGTPVPLFSALLANTSYGTSPGFNLLTGPLAAGDFIDFAAGPNSEYTYDTTGISATITRLDAEAAVPEPATWGLMLAGFGLAGGALRTPRRVAFA